MRLMKGEQQGKIQPTRLSLHDQVLAGTEGRHQELPLRRRYAISLKNLLEGSIPDRRDLGEHRRTYERLAAQQLFPFSFREGDSQEFLLVGPRLSAFDVNSLMFFSSPNKEAGLNTPDILADWTILYFNSARFRKLRNQHKGMLGWGTFEQSKDLLLGLFQRNTNFFLPIEAQSNPTDVVIPVLRWTEKDGKRTVSLKPLTPSMRSAIAQQLPEHVTDPQRLDCVTGYLFLAAYSPDQTHWLPRNNFPPGSDAELDGDGNLMGTAQVAGLVVRKLAERQSEKYAHLVPDNQDIQQSPLLEKVSAYIQMATSS